MYTFSCAKTAGVLKNAAIVIPMLLAGCASIVDGTGQIVTIEARNNGAIVQGANCRLENKKGIFYVTAPGTVTVHRASDTLMVNCEKKDVAPGSVSVKSSTKGMAFGNILFGGIIGAVVDVSSGAAYDYPTLITVPMGDGAVSALAAAGYSWRKLSGPEMKSRFTDLGGKPGYNRVGGRMFFDIHADGKLEIRNVDKNVSTTGSYLVKKDGSQICLKINGDAGWKPMEHCYNLYQINADTFAMHAVVGKYFFTYTTSQASWTSNAAVTPPAPSAFADIADASAVPFIEDKGKERYKTFLASPSPKAFAINEKGSWQFYAGDPAAMSKALTICMARSGVPCWLYAVDDKVVWQPEPGKRSSLEQLNAPQSASAAGALPASASASAH
jgi:hypothetical protein